MPVRRPKLLLLAGLLVGLVGAELVVRALDIGPVPGGEVRGSVGRKSENERLRAENVPGNVMITRYHDRHGRLLREFETCVNAQGLRGEEVEVGKPPGTFRIACFGDSQTFGLGVGEGEDWPAVLRASLRRMHPGRSIEVLNFGVGGYEVEQCVAMLEERAAAFSPDLVVLGFFLNDSALPGTTPVEMPGSFSSELILFLGPQRPGLFRTLRDHLRLLDLAADWGFRKLTFRRWIVQRNPLFADDYEGWQRTQAAFLRARSFAEGRGAGFTVVLVPLLVRHGDELLSSEPYRKVAAFCRGQGIPCYDPEPLFAGRDVDRMRVHPRDAHSNTEAHALIGTGLAAWLTRQGLIAAAR